MVGCLDGWQGDHCNKSTSSHKSNLPFPFFILTLIILSFKHFFFFKHVVTEPMDTSACKIVVLTAKTKRVILQTVPVYQNALQIMKEKCATKRHVYIVNKDIHTFILI